MAISETFWLHCGKHWIADDGQARSLNSAENAKINANCMNRTCINQVGEFELVIYYKNQSSIFAMVFCEFQAYFATQN